MRNLLRLASITAVIVLGCAPSAPPPTSPYCPLPTQSWPASSPQQWHDALEGYVPSVRRDNQSSIRNVRAPFAYYLVHAHNRIHPLFAEDFIGSLCALPVDHPMNNPKLMTRIEIALDREEGRIVKMGVVRSSGVTAFDVGALDSMKRASPFGKPDARLLSADGNMYFHWEMHRDPVFACSTINSRPFLLTAPADQVGAVDASVRLPEDAGVND